MSGQKLTAADLFNLAASGATSTTPPAQPVPSQIAAQPVTSTPSVQLHPILGIPIGPGTDGNEPSSPSAPVDPLEALMATLPTGTEPQYNGSSATSSPAPVPVPVPVPTAAPESPVLAAPPLNLITQPAAAISSTHPKPVSTTPVQRPHRASVSSPVNSAKDLISDTTSSSTKAAGRALEGDSYAGLASQDRQQFTVTDITMYQWDNVQHRGNVIAVSEHYIAYAIRGYMIRAIHIHSGHRLLFRGHPANVNDIVCHPDKSLSLFASIDDSGAVCVWQPSPDETENSAYPLFSVELADRLPERKGLRVQWNPASKTQFAITTADHLVKIWDFAGTAPKTKVVDALKYGQGEIAPVAVFSPPIATSEVRSIHWSEDGARFLVSCVNTDGTSQVYVLASDYTPMYSFRPQTVSGHEIAIDSAVYVPGRETSRMVTVANDGTLVQVWKVDHETTASAEISCVRAFTITGHAEHPQVETVAHITSDGAFLVLADRLNKAVYIVDTAGNFSFVSEYSLRQPGLSFTPVIEASADDGSPELKLYLVQTGAIQVYSSPLTPLRGQGSGGGENVLCSAPTYAVSVSVTPRAATPAAPVDSVPPEHEQELELELELEQESVRDSPSPVDDGAVPEAPADWPGDFDFDGDVVVNPHHENALEALTALLPALEGKVSVEGGEMSAPVETPEGTVRIMKRADTSKPEPSTPAPHAAAVSGEPARDATLPSTTSSSDNATSQQPAVKEKGKKDNSNSASASQRDLQRLEQSLVKNIGKVFNARVDKMKIEQDKQNKAMLKALQSQMSTSIQSSLQKELKKEIVPMVKKVVKDHLDSSVMKPVNDSLSKLLVQFNQGVVTNIGNSVKKPMNHAFQKQFEDTIVPAFERACETMLLQLDNTVKAGIAHNLKPTIDALVNAQNQTTQELIRLRAQVAQMQAAVSGGHLAAAPRHPGQPQPAQVPHQPDPTELKIREVNNLLAQQNLESAFITGLSAANLRVVDHLLHAVTPDKAHGLSQRVLLPLIQQITTGFGTEHTAKKITWMLEATTALDPANPDIRAHVPAVLDAATNKVQHALMPESPVWKSLTPQQQRELRTLSLALTGTRRKV